MRKLILLIVLGIALPAWGDVTIVKSLMSDNCQWDGYQPLGDGRYMRYIYTNPINNVGSSGLLGHHSTMLGRVYPARQYPISMCQNTGAATVNFSGTPYTGSDWSTNTLTVQGNFSYIYQATKDKFLQCAIPEGMNRIQALVMNRGGGGANLNFQWSDDSTTGLALTSYNTDTGTTAWTEVTIATAADTTGGKNLRIYHRGALATASSAVTFTDGAGDEDVVNWVGHGLINSDPVKFTGDALPTDLVAGTTYYVKWISADSFSIYTTSALTTRRTFTGAGTPPHTGTPGDFTAYFLGLRCWNTNSTAGDPADDADENGIADGDCMVDTATPSTYGFTYAGVTNYSTALTLGAAASTWAFSWAPGDTATVTFTDAGDVVNWDAHGFTTGQPVTFTTTGALPGTLSTATTYYARSTAAGTFTIHATTAGAVAGTGQVTFNSTESGVHTGHRGVMFCGDTAHYDALGTPGNGNFRVTGTSAEITYTDSGTDDVVNWTGHGLTDGQPVWFNTTVSVPSGMTRGRVYYVKSLGEDTFAIYTDSSLATKQTITSVGSGTHYCHTANGPALYVDGVSKGSMLDQRVNAKGQMYSGDVASYYVLGFSDYDNDGMDDADEPAIAATTTLDEGGYAGTVAVTWDAASDLGEIYVGMFPYRGDNVSPGDYLLLPDQSKKYMDDYAYTSPPTWEVGAGWIRHVLPAQRLEVTLSSPMPTRAVYYQGYRNLATVSCKAYNLTQIEHMLPGGADQPDGGTMIISGRVDVAKQGKGGGGGWIKWGN